MIQFIKSTLSERGDPSIKRVALTGFSLVWVVSFFVNLFSGKSPDEYLRNQLFELILVCIGAVFGINILNGLKDIKFKQADANQAVGSPTPTPDTTVITEKPTT